MADAQRPSWPLPIPFEIWTSGAKRCCWSRTCTPHRGAFPRKSDSDPFLHHLDIALGSQGEVDVQIELALRLDFLPSAGHKALQSRVDRIGRMLNGLIESLQPNYWDADK